MILVTGGTGFVGREIVRQLREAGHRVRVLVRHPDKAARLVQQYGCEVVRGDVLDPESLAPAMKGVDAIIHLVGIIRETRRVTFEQAHTDGTENVLTAAKAAGVRRFVHMSALGTRENAASRYHQSKWEAERLVRRSGLDWTILRPSLIYGPDDQSFNIIALFMRWPLDMLNYYSFPNLGGGHSRVQPVAVGEVAQAFVHALSNPAALGQTYDLCGKETLTWSDVFLVLAQREGVDAILDRHSIRMALRSLLWVLILGLPLLLMVTTFLHVLSLKLAIILVGVEVALIIIERAWRRFLLYDVSWAFLHFCAGVTDRLLPRWARFSEQLKMLKEDNVGDSAPAERDLHVTFRGFAEAQAALHRH